MTSKQLTDHNGDSVHVFEWEGQYLPPNFTAEQRENVRHLVVRPDDIFICGYLRSGLHWVREIVKMVLQGKASPVENDVLKGWLENPDLAFDTLQQMSSPRVFASHMRFTDLPEKVRELRCKVIYLERDVKDSAVSCFNLLTHFKPEVHRYEGKWDGYATMFLQGKVHFNSWFDHVKSYRTVPASDPEYSILILTYEDLRKNPVREIQRISSFLELPDDRAVADDIARLTEFSSMKRYKEMDEKNSEPLMFKSGKNDFYRKGVVGDWKNWFTVAQSEAYDTEFERQMGQKYMQPDM